LTVSAWPSTGVRGRARISGSSAAGYELPKVNSRGGNGLRHAEVTMPAAPVCARLAGAPLPFLYKNEEAENQQFSFMAACTS
jgi:hypothetical protein